ncbi:hypothetical protein LXA43DRAFT_628810 [Ganoderma leucocontextum]|nr:hypothetical protein LXA43DRAFT_628810 [Ganoderma leucocontextum]
MTSQRTRRKASDPYSGSGFVLEENETHAIPAHSDTTPHLEKPEESPRASSTVHWSRLINYALTALLFTVILSLVLVYGEEIPFLRDTPLISTPLVLSLHRYARPSERLSPRLRRQVDAVVREALASQIGRRDYALAADGGSIVSRMTSGPVSLPGSPERHPALVLLEHNLHGGRCWAVQGDQAQVSIRTPERIRLRSITVDHVPREVAEDPNQAPRRMRLWGAVDGRENTEQYAQYLASTTPLFRDGPVITQGWTFLHLLDFEYDLFGTDYVQTFPLDYPVRDLKMDFGVFVVEILDNWGSRYLCPVVSPTNGTGSMGLPV